MAYSLHILDLSPFTDSYARDFTQLQQMFQLQDEEFELVYDWIITEALTRLIFYYGLNSSRTVNQHNHYKHDIYELCLNQVAYQLVPLLQSQLERFNLTVFKYNQVKVLVTGRDLMLAIGQLQEKGS